MMRRLLTIFLSFTTLGLIAQINNVVVDTDYRLQQGSVDVAINTKDPANVVVASDLNRISVSLDSGATWQKKLILPDNGILGKSELHADRRGRFFLIASSVDQDDDWEASEISGRLITFMSDDKGMTWELVSEIDETSEQPVSNFSSSINVVSGDFYSVWESESGDANNIMFSMASAGKNWSKPVELIHEPANAEPYGLSPAPGASGQVYVIWADEGKIKLDRTYNKGKMWLRNDISIADVTGDFQVPGYAGPAGFPVSATDLSGSNFKGALYITWPQLLTDDQGSEIHFIRSTNKGDSWSRSGRISNPAEGAFQFSPAITVDPATGLLYIAYFSRVGREDNHSDVYLAWSLDGGGSFKQAKINTDPVNTEGFEYLHNGLSLTAFQGIVCPTWISKGEKGSNIISACMDYKDLGIK